jgi:hypothetical protein
MKTPKSIKRPPGSSHVFMKEYAANMITTGTPTQVEIKVIPSRLFIERTLRDGAPARRNMEREYAIDMPHSGQDPSGASPVRSYWHLTHCRAVSIELASLLDNGVPRIV